MFQTAVVNVISAHFELPLIILGCNDIMKQKAKVDKKIIIHAMVSIQGFLKGDIKS